MCGLAGIMTSAGHSGSELGCYTSRMIATLTHRGPDDSGIWTDQRCGIALGFRRLAIVDLSPSGHQPMRSASGRYVLAFNGEIYNFQELRRELEPYGYPFRGHSDTEVILAAFEHWGIREAVCRFVGMFAMAVWDAARRELSLCRDRLGKKPLYVYSEPGLVTFGSELKALVAGPSFDRTIDRHALASYLRYLYVPAPRTIFERAIKLPSAHILTVSDPRLSVSLPRPYWSLREVALRGLAHPLSGSEDEVIGELDRLLADAVKRRMYADVPIGALLSGGVDSSAVVALMQEASTRPVRTYTIGFAEKGFNEAGHAADVARHLGTDHTDLVVTADDAQALVPRLPDVFDEPFANPSQLPTLLVCQLARRHVTVALCGDGGDELFAGYNRYRFGAGILACASRLPRRLRQSMAAAFDNVPTALWGRLSGWATGGDGQQGVDERVRKLSALLHAGGVGDMYRSLLSAAWQQPDDLLGGDHRDDDRARRLMESAEPRHLLDRMMLADQAIYLPDDALAKMDRASMAVNLEVRAPLLDHRVVELSWRMPRTLKLRGGVGKWALRQVLYRRVPQALIDRPKMGFTVPIDRWLRGPLSRWADDLLLDASTDRQQLLDTAKVSDQWLAFKQGRHASGLGLWAVLMLRAWTARWAA
jgi:asparagine synthase (glutamine-hydrolysing)